jgi:hypothetical protein
MPSVIVVNEVCDSVSSFATVVVSVSAVPQAENTQATQASERIIAKTFLKFFILILPPNFLYSSKMLKLLNYIFNE